MKRIGIYHYQYYRGACKLCYRHFIQEMVESYEKCHETAKKIYGEDCEFFHYTDFGQYESENTDRPSYRRMEAAIEAGELDVLMCFTLNTITTDDKKIVELYQKVREKGMDFLTAKHGKDAMKFIDLYMEKNGLSSK